MKYYRNHPTSQRGMSLVELLIVMAILGILGLAIAQMLSTGTKMVEFTTAQSKALQATESLAEKFAGDRLVEPRSGTIFVTSDGITIDPQQDVPNARKFVYHAYSKSLENGMNYVLVQVDGEKGWTTHSSANYITEIADTGGEDPK